MEKKREGGYREENDHRTERGERDGKTSHGTVGVSE